MKTEQLDEAVASPVYLNMPLGVFFSATARPPRHPRKTGKGGREVGAGRRTRAHEPAHYQLNLGSMSVIGILQQLSVEGQTQLLPIH